MVSNDSQQVAHRVSLAPPTTSNAIDVGILIQQITASQFHIGIVARDQSSSTWRHFHQPWHERSLEEETPPKGIVIYPDLPKELKPILAMWCRKVARSNKGLPYGFSLPSNSVFLNDGVYKPTPGHTGFTCATFVLTIFWMVPWKLIDERDWPPPTANDAGWQQWIINKLRSVASMLHITSLEKQIPALRLPPQFVAAASIAEVIPALHSELRSNAANFEAALATNDPQKVTVPSTQSYRP